MVVGEGQRRALHDRLGELLGMDGADVLMEYLPPSGWGDVARRSDVDHVERLLRMEMASMETRLTSAIDALGFELRGEIAELRGEMGLLRADVGGEVAELRGEMGRLRADVGGEIAELRGEMGTLRGEMGTLRGEMGLLRGEMEQLRGELRGEMAKQTRTVIVGMATMTVGMLGALVTTLLAMPR